jgi:hypothetical protein
LIVNLKKDNSQYQMNGTHEHSQHLNGHVDHNGGAYVIYFKLLTQVYNSILMDTVQLPAQRTKMENSLNQASKNVSLSLWMMKKHSRIKLENTKLRHRRKFQSLE